MPYRDEQRCHLCGALTRATCPSCDNPVCTEHTLAGRLEGASAAERADGERLARRVGGLEACERCVEREVEASRGPFVEIMRSGDPIQTQMAVETLTEAGFDARAIGTRNAALLGVGQHILEQRIEVPEPQAEAALAALASLQAGAPIAEGDVADDGEEDQPESGEQSESGDDDVIPPPPPRRRGVAAGLAFIFPGGSHYYARHAWTGLLLTLTFFVGLVRAAQGAELAAVVMMLGAVALDLVAGQLALSALNRGKPRSTTSQLVQGAIMAALLAGLGELATRIGP